MRFEEIKVSRSWNGQPVLEITLPKSESHLAEELIGIEAEKYELTIKKTRKKRSLDSNAYAWVLIQQIAEKVHSSKEEVYMQMLQRYSRAFTHVIVRESAINKVKEIWRTVIDLGEITVNGQTAHQLQCYYGSSTFDSKEMSVFLDGIVSECKELGIQTETPTEIERMKSLWNG